MPIDLIDYISEDTVIAILLHRPQLSLEGGFSPSLLTEDRAEIATAVCNLQLTGKQVTPHAVALLMNDGEMKSKCEKYMSRGLPRDSFSDLLDRLRDRLYRRRIAGLCYKYHTWVNSEEGSAAEELSKFEADALSLRSDTGGTIHDGRNISSLLEELKWRAMNPMKVRGLRFGMPKFEAMIDGLKGGFLITIGARPSVGKTAFMKTMIHNQLRAGLSRPGVFSLEMSGMRIQQRIVAAEAGVSLMSSASKPLNENELERIYQATQQMTRWEWYYSDAQRVTLPQLISDARRCVKQRGVDSIYIDYLQLIRVPEHASDKRMAVSECTARLKLLAEELDVPVIVAAQLRRPPSPQYNKYTKETEIRPAVLEDLKESGSIEEDSDIVALINRDDTYAEVDVAKDRDGPTGQIIYDYDLQTTTFKEEV